MKIEIWSDLICPWCYIGKRRFETALQQFEHRSLVDVIWRSFELDPHAPTESHETLVEMLARKYAVSPQQAVAMNANVSAIAAQEGLDYHLEHARPGNTFTAHRLVHYAESLARGEAMTECLMHGYFTEALPIGEPEALAMAAVKAGFPETGIRTILSSEQYSAEVRADEQRAAQLRIRGVPFFLFNEKVGISGAQGVEVFVQALETLMVK